ncbi:hypothetical protein G6553_12025 [Nocardioides sp. IC4_145]|uniref:hypothetical protein n=1 Tax=Nocardioides sp. IC4_145 TaxID=2714037 RepID=UPI001408F9D1|nr:hypothetical protein [Nocardioides sp. IC4_145]NHC23898.1 hypothetical protein [Nocardioides sp. IC4_145]
MPRVATLLLVLAVLAVALLVRPPVDRIGTAAGAPGSRATTAEDFCAGMAALDDAHLAFASDPSPETVAELRDRAVAMMETVATAEVGPQVAAGVAYRAGLFVGLPNDATIDDVTSADAAATVTDSANVQALSDHVRGVCADPARQ